MALPPLGTTDGRMALKVMSTAYFASGAQQVTVLREFEQKFDVKRPAWSSWAAGFST